MKKHKRLFGPVATGKWTVLAYAADSHGGSSVTLQQHHGPYPVQGGSYTCTYPRRGGRIVAQRHVPGSLASAEETQDRRGARGEGGSEDGSHRVSTVTSAGAAGGAARRQTLSGLGRAHRRHAQGRTRCARKWVVHVDSATGRVLLIFDNVQTAGPVVGNGARAARRRNPQCLVQRRHLSAARYDTHGRRRTGDHRQRRRRRVPVRRRRERLERDDVGPPRRAPGTGGRRAALRRRRGRLLPDRPRPATVSMAPVPT